MGDGVLVNDSLSCLSNDTHSPMIDVRFYILALLIVALSAFSFSSAFAQSWFPLWALEEEQPSPMMGLIPQRDGVYLNRRSNETLRFTTNSSGTIVGSHLDAAGAFENVFCGREIRNVLKTVFKSRYSQETFDGIFSHGSMQAARPGAGLSSQNASSDVQITDAEACARIAIGSYERQGRNSKFVANHDEREVDCRALLQAAVAERSNLTNARNFILKGDPK